jgi:hypothetical protein
MSIADGKVEWRDPERMTIGGRTDESLARLGWENLGFVREESFGGGEPETFTPWGSKTPTRARFDVTDLGPLTLQIDKMSEEMAAIMYGGFPRRIMLGVEQPASELHLDNPTARHENCRSTVIANALHGSVYIAPLDPRTTRPKETTMIDKSDFLATASKVRADNLAARDLGSLVTITTPNGVEITDILEAIRADLDADHVDLELVYTSRSDYESFWEIDPKSVVLVRRPKATKKAAK